MPRGRAPWRPPHYPPCPPPPLWGHAGASAVPPPLFGGMQAPRQCPPPPLWGHAGASAVPPPPPPPPGPPPEAPPHTASHALCQGPPADVHHPQSALVPGPAPPAHVQVAPPSARPLHLVHLATGLPPPPPRAPRPSPGAAPQAPCRCPLYGPALMCRVRGAERGLQTWQSGQSGGCPRQTARVRIRRAPSGGPAHRGRCHLRWFRRPTSCPQGLDVSPDGWGGGGDPLRHVPHVASDRGPCRAPLRRDQAFASWGRGRGVTACPGEGISVGPSPTRQSAQ